MRRRRRRRRKSESLQVLWVCVRVTSAQLSMTGLWEGEARGQVACAIKFRRRRRGEGRPHYLLPFLPQKKKNLLCFFSPPALRKKGWPLVFFFEGEKVSRGNESAMHLFFAKKKRANGNACYFVYVFFQNVTKVIHECRKSQKGRLRETLLIKTEGIKKTERKKKGEPKSAASPPLLSRKKMIIKKEIVYAELPGGISRYP